MLLFGGSQPIRAGDPSPHWQPVPGYQSDHIPVEIRADGSRPDNQDDDSGDYKPVIVEQDPGGVPEIHRSRVAGIRVRHADIGKFGATPGCPACGKSHAR